MKLKLKTSLALLSLFNFAVANANNANTVDISRSESNLADTGLVVNGDSYEILQNSSTLEFRVDSPVGEVWGNFQDFNGSFLMQSSFTHNKSTVIHIFAESLDTNTSFIRAMLKSESFFDVEKFPSMRFEGGSFEWFNETNAVLKGELTIQEKTRPVAFYIELVNENSESEYSGRITVKASTTIRRSEFGMYTLLPIVSDDVNIFITIEALKKETTVSMKRRNVLN